MILSSENRLYTKFPLKLVGFGTAIILCSGLLVQCPTKEGLINSDMLIISGRGESRKDQTALTPLQRELRAREEARRDAEKRLVGMFVVPRVACGSIDSESLIKVKEIRRLLKRAEVIDNRQK